MIFVQIILGGITRLTGSGLSITEWNLIMGVLPPLNEAQWLNAFHKYQQIPQFKVLNSHFSLSDFKGIFFWEYFHRLWARAIGVVFLIPFLYFIIKKRITKKLWVYLSIAFVLGAVQGLIGWIMVKSGLSDRIWVSPLKLALHLLGALVLLSWMEFICLKSSWNNSLRLQSTNAKNFSIWLTILLLFQVALGGLMAGSHAATFYPTWPDMNGAFMPQNIFAQSPWWLNFLNNVTTIQFFHRGMAYLLLVLITFYSIWLIKYYRANTLIFSITCTVLILLFVQVTLGVLTLFGSSKGSVPIVYAVLHQCVGLLLYSMIFSLSLFFKKSGEQVIAKPGVSKSFANI
jgi:cytochrome c oxidase assembly protein subunit 15